MSTVREGDRISNYVLETPLGAGSFGEVWRARHHVLDEVVAIKIPTDSQYVRNLQREGVAVHGLRQPNVVRVIDLDPYADPPYLIMEYVEGPSLRAAIDALKPDFDINAAVVVMRGVLQALAAAHDAGMIHRDVKPANILLKHPLDMFSSMTEQAVKITVFVLGHVGGVTTQSIMQSGSEITEGGRSIAGTLAYMSPEQKEGGELDARSDLYACGIVLFELLTGELPQGNDAPGSVRADVPAHLDEVFRRSYTRRERRYGSAGEMLAALRVQAVPRRRVARHWAAPGSTPQCPACQSTVHSDDQFCIMCGHQLVEAVPRCPSCQGFVHWRDRFCIFCGSDLRVLT
ncbi:MAG: protein kinase [Phycisphaerales bacterium]|nr:MAG: protein kinase [Phycisphaerales bacterium]